MADNSTRYGKSSAGGGAQDQGEHKDVGWESRQGGSQGASHPQQGGRSGGRDRSDDRDRSDEGNRARSDQQPDQAADEPAGTDQPPRMGGPLGPDPKNPHLPEGAQNSDTQGTGAGGFDRGVNATNVGAVHQGARPEDPRDATSEPPTG